MLNRLNPWLEMPGKDGTESSVLESGTCRAN
jgi:hypothetical protein